MAGQGEIREERGESGEERKRLGKKKRTGGQAASGTGSRQQALIHPSPRRRNCAAEQVSSRAGEQVKEERVEGEG